MSTPRYVAKLGNARGQPAGQRIISFVPSLVREA
jgi:hypothetical protein